MLGVGENSMYMEFTDKVKLMLSDIDSIYYYYDILFHMMQDYINCIWLIALTFTLMTTIIIGEYNFCTFEIINIHCNY